jgi:FtsZ-binding cell division protein ZapB
MTLGTGRCSLLEENEQLRIEAKQCRQEANEYYEQVQQLRSLLARMELRFKELTP